MITLEYDGDIIYLRRPSFGDSMDIGSPKLLARKDSNDTIRFVDATWHGELSYNFNVSIMKCVYVPIAPPPAPPYATLKADIDAWLMRTYGYPISYDDGTFQMVGILTLSDCVERLETYEMSFVITEVLQ